MSENFLAPDLNGSPRIRQRQGLSRRVRTETLGQRGTGTYQNPAAKRRHSLAPDVSPGYPTRSGAESRRDDTSSSSHSLTPEASDTPVTSVIGAIPNTLYGSFAAMNSGISHPGNECPAPSTNLKCRQVLGQRYALISETAALVALWNERYPQCI